MGAIVDWQRCGPSPLNARQSRLFLAVTAFSERARGVSLTIIPDSTLSDAALSARFAADIISQAREAASRRRRRWACRFCDRARSSGRRVCADLSKR